MSFMLLYVSLFTFVPASCMQLCVLGIGGNHVTHTMGGVYLFEQDVVWVSKGEWVSGCSYSRDKYT